MTIDSWLQIQIQNLNTNPSSLTMGTKRQLIYVVSGLIAMGGLLFLLFYPFVAFLAFFKILPFSYSKFLSSVDSIDRFWIFLWIIFFIIFYFFRVLAKDKKIRRKIWKEYKQKMPDGVEFLPEEYQKAAQILQKFKPVRYKKAIEEYEKKYVDILILSQSVGQVKSKKFERIVSLKSIEEDREAGFEE